MTPINEVPVGKFCRFENSIAYVYKNDFKTIYGLLPITDTIPTDKKFDHKVYIYKRVKPEWVNKAKEWLNAVHISNNGQTLYKGRVVEDDVKIDNLLYIENLDILKSYEH